MEHIMRTRLAAGLAAVAALSFTAACSGTTAESPVKAAAPLSAEPIAPGGASVPGTAPGTASAPGSAPGTLPGTAPASPAGSPGAGAGGVFGPACASIPSDPANPGSLRSIARQPAANAIAASPTLSTFASAITKANLGDQLNRAGALTIFAPTNDAFAKIPQGDLKNLLNNQSRLQSVIKFHVLNQRLAPNKLAGTHRTQQGQDVTVNGSGTNFTVNNTANVVCGNVPTSNATLYFIDTVLMPS
jgi:uncharacterized surface protein with fasciclin (FAS1) repeats